MHDGVDLYEIRALRKETDRPYEWTKAAEEVAVTQLPDALNRLRCVRYAVTLRSA